MTPKTKIYIALAAAAAITIGMLTASLWSDHKIGKLERSVETAKRDAETIESESRRLEQEAAAYKEKIEYLEGSLSEIETIARRQDEEIKELSKDATAARDGVRRARAVRSIESTGAELCAKLAELGHACRE